VNANERAPWFVPPDGFEVFATDRDPAERAAGLVLLLQDFRPEATPERRIRCALTQDAFLTGLDLEGVVHLSTCPARKEDGGCVGVLHAARRGGRVASAIDGGPVGDEPAFARSGSRIADLFG
jgi:hypothetical protein